MTQILHLVHEAPLDLLPSPAHAQPLPCPLIIYSYLFAHLYSAFPNQGLPF